MRGRYLLGSFGLFAVVYGILLIVSPQGLGHFRSTGSEFEFLSHINQSRAPTLAGLGIISWLFRDLDSSAAMPNVLIALIVVNALMSVSVALSQFTPAATPTGWPLAALHAGWAAGFAYLRLRPRSGGNHA